LQAGRGNVRDESVHGRADNRNYAYDPTFIRRGLSNSNVTFTPAK
jgi:hypothetical protein